MNSLHLEISSGRSGSTRSLAEALRSWPLGSSRLVHCPLEASTEILDSIEGVTTQPLPLPPETEWSGTRKRLFFSMLMSVWQTRQAFAALDSWPLEMIHINNEPKLGLAYHLLSQKRNVPLFSHQRKVRPMLKSDLMIARRCQALIALSQTQKDLWLAQGFDAGRIALMYNPLPQVDRLFAPPERLCWGVVSTPSREKGHPLLREAWHQLRRKHGPWDITLLMRGDPPSEIHEEIDWRPACDRLDDVYAPLSLVIDPSQTVEGFRRTILEAGAYARPVLATDTGSAREVIEDGVTGFLAPLGQQGLVEAMERAWKRRHHWAEMGVALQQRVRSLESDYPDLHTCFISRMD